MGIIMKLIANPVLRAIVVALLQWLGSRVAAFVAKHIGHASEIVKQAAILKKEDGTDFNGIEKFQWASARLKMELKEVGVDARQTEVDSAIQAAWGIVWAELEKANKA